MTATSTIVIGFTALACGLLAGFLVGYMRGQQQSCDKWMRVLREKDEKLRKQQALLNVPLRTWRKPQWMDNDADSEK